MKSQVAVLIVAILGAVFCSDVLEFTDNDFQSKVADEDIILVEFFAPWCGHCKRLAPEYEKAATTLKNNDPPVPLAKVDCVGEGKETCGKYGVSGYPTLKIFRGGEVSQDYDGPRDADGIVGYMKKHSGPSSVEIKDEDHLEKKLDAAEDILIVGYFSEENELYKRFQKAADQQRSTFAFAHSLKQDVNTKKGYNDVVVLHRPKHMHAKFEPNAEVFDNTNANTHEIVNFINEKKNGLVGQISPTTEETFSKPTVMVIYKIDWKRDPKGARYWRNRVARVAKKFIGEITFTIGHYGDYDRQVGDWNFPRTQDICVILQAEKKQTFKMMDTFSVENLEKFVNEYKDGALKPYIKSEPLPIGNKKPVKVVVGESFDEIVNDPTKDVLIEFYAPWCGHCKSLEPKYFELAVKLRDSKDIVIAKMDATANDVPYPYEVQGFPTIYWSPMGSKDSPKKYQGGREVKDFIEFIKREATNPVVIEEKKKKKKKTEL